MNKYQEALLNIRYYYAQSQKYKKLQKYNAIRQLETLQELVDRDTPKKPVNWKAERRINGKVEFNCPVCNRLYTERVNFCSSCGQGIDWGLDQ